MSNKAAITGRTLARGAMWSVGGQLASLILQILTISLLGRLLDPGDFGTVAMVTAIIGIGELVRDFGLGTAAIQAPTITRAERTNLFWLNSLIGGALGAFFLVFAGLVSDFYEQPSLSVITQVLSITFLLNGIATQPRADLIRNLRQEAVAATEMLSSVVALIIGVAIAVTGLGFWAIVGMQVSRAATRMVLALAFSKFVPSLPNRQVTVRPYIRFGLGLLGAKALNYVSKNVDTVLIGRTLGATLLGFYSRSYQLAFMPISQLSEPLSRVALPTLSKLHNNDRKYIDFLFRAQSILILVASAGYTIAVVYADVVIRIALGPGWDSSVPVFRVLCVAGIFEAAHQVTYWLFVSKGNTLRHFRFALLTRPLLIIAIILAVPFGISSVALAFLTWIIVAWPIGLYWSCAGTPVSALLIFRRAIRIILSALLIAGMAALTRLALSTHGLPVEIGVSGIVMVFSAGLILLLCVPVRTDVNDALRTIKLVLPTK